VFYTIELFVLLIWVRVAFGASKPDAAV